MVEISYVLNNIIYCFFTLLRQEETPPETIKKPKVRRQLPPKEEVFSLQSVQLKPTPKKKVEKVEEVVEEISPDLKFSEKRLSSGEISLDTLEIKQIKSSMKTSTVTSSTSAQGTEETSFVQESQSLSVETSQTTDEQSLSASKLKVKTTKVEQIEEATPEKKEMKKRRKLLPKEEEKQETIQLKPTPKKVVKKEEEIIEEVSPDLDKYKGSDIGSGGVELDKLELKKSKTTKPKVSKAEETTVAAPQVCTFY